MNSVTRRLLLFGVPGTILLALAFWIVYSSYGLPDVRLLKAYAPATETIIPGEACVGPILAVPPSELKSLRPFLPLASKRVPEQIARTMLCGQRGSTLVHSMNEIRLALQIRCLFNGEEQQAIYLNRAYLGDGIFGVSEAARQYMGLRVDELSPAQGALIVGLLSNPAYYSPYRHPDRALVRRNAVIEDARRRAAVSEAIAAAARAAPLQAK